MKALYLTEDYVKRVELDHEAIRVIALQHSDTWFPLSRLSRVIILGNFQLETGVLHRLMQAGIPVSLGQKNGVYSGLCLGESTNRYNLSDEIQENYISQDGEEYLEDWFSMQHRILCRRIVRQFRLGRMCKKSSTVLKQLDQRIAQNYRFCYWKQVIEQIRPMLSAHLAEFLQAYGFKRGLITQTGVYQGIHRHLVELLILEFWQRGASGHLPSQHSVKAVCRYYEKNAVSIEKQAQRWVGRLWKKLLKNHHESF